MGAQGLRPPQCFTTTHEALRDELDGTGKGKVRTRHQYTRRLEEGTWLWGVGAFGPLFRKMSLWVRVVPKNKAYMLLVAVRGSRGISFLALDAVDLGRSHDRKLQPLQNSSQQRAGAVALKAFKPRA